MFLSSDHMLFFVSVLSLSLEEKKIPFRKDFDFMQNLERNMLPNPPLSTGIHWRNDILELGITPAFTLLTDFDSVRTFPHSKFLSCNSKLSEKNTSETMVDMTCHTPHKPGGSRNHGTFGIPRITTPPFPSPSPFSPLPLPPSPHHHSPLPTPLLTSLNSFSHPEPLASREE